MNKDVTGSKQIPKPRQAAAALSGSGGCAGRKGTAESVSSSFLPTKPHHPMPPSDSLSFFQEVVAAYHQGGALLPDMQDDQVESVDALKTPDVQFGRLCLGQDDSIMPVRFVFRHCPSVLDAAKVQTAWRDTLLEEPCLREVHGRQDTAEVAEVLWLKARGWPLSGLEQRQVSWQALVGMTALLHLPAKDIQARNLVGTPPREPLEQVAGALAENLPCRLVIVTESQGVSGILLVTQQVLCDAQTLQNVLVRFWHRLQSEPYDIPPWDNGIAAPVLAEQSLAYWRQTLVNGRFSLLPRDPAPVPPGAPLLNTQATFVSQDQWRLLQQAAAVLEVDLETIMLSAFARWLMLLTQSDGVLFSVVTARPQPLPVRPPEMKPFSISAGERVDPSDWVGEVAAELDSVRQMPMPHLKALAEALNQDQSTFAHMMLECIFCFEPIELKWPTALAPVDSFGNASGQLGAYAMLQLSIDITDERMRLTWWGLARMISKPQLAAYERGYRQVLFELLGAVLQSEHWTAFDAARKQVLALTLPDTRAEAVQVRSTKPGQTEATVDVDRTLSLGEGAPSHVLKVVQKLVSEAPDTLVVASSRAELSRLELWLSAALVAQEVFSQHPQFDCGQTHHGVIVMSNDPQMLAVLTLATQMCQLVPLLVSVDARRTLLADTKHKAWRKVGHQWLVTTRALPDGVPPLEKTIVIDGGHLFGRVRRALRRCKALGIDFSISLSQQALGAKTLPAQDVGVLRAVSRFFTGPLFEGALCGQLEDPILGYFDPIAAIESAVTLVTNSRYWCGQVDWIRHQQEVLVQADRTLLVGQQLDHAGFWPFYSSFLAGLPVMWVLPHLLIDAPQGATYRELPRRIAQFLHTAGQPQVPAQPITPQPITAHPPDERPDVLPSPKTSSVQALTFMTELCFALLATDTKLRVRLEQLQRASHIITLGYGRLSFPSNKAGFRLPTTLLVVSDHDSARFAGNHAGDPYNCAARIPLGLVEPVHDDYPAIHDNVVLKSLLPQHFLFAFGYGVQSLAYGRSALRLEIDGFWSVSSHQMPTGSLLEMSKPGANDTAYRCRWHLAVNTVIRERAPPVIEPMDLPFQPQGSWSAPCRFWERLVRRFCQSCWIMLRPESQTAGIAAARIIAYARFGTEERNQERIARFADVSSWVRLYTAVGKHWGSGVTPRWSEIFGRKFEPHVVRSLSDSMTFTRLAQWALRLAEPPGVSQTWAALGGDWFAFFRFSFVLRRLGWEWAVPIRTLHQPLGRLALSVRRAEAISSVLALPSLAVTREGSLSTRSTGQRVPRLADMALYSVPLSGYQLGIFRRFSDSLSQQVHRLQFYYSGALSLVDLRASLNRWIALFPALTSYFELTGQGMQQRFAMPIHERLQASYLQEAAGESPPGGGSGALPQAEAVQPPRWDALVDRALRFQHEPFESAFAEKFAIEEHTQKLQLQVPPLWRCLVYPKGQGRWSVWLLAHPLLLDTREWLDSVRCLELLLFKGQDTQRNMFWLDSTLWPGHMYSKAICQISHNRQCDRLPQSVQDTVASFWRERNHVTDRGRLPEVTVTNRGRAPCVTTVIQPLSPRLSGDVWLHLSSRTGVDRLSVLSWALISVLARFAQCDTYRFDLQSPWASMASAPYDLLAGQNGLTPVFIHLPESDPMHQLAAVKQQLYECLLTPNPETLLVPGDMDYEQLYDAVYQQSVCMTYLERLPENPDLSAMADVEQIRALTPGELVGQVSAYLLKVEAFPSRGRFVFAWSFDERKIQTKVVDQFIQSVDEALHELLDQLHRLAMSGLAQSPINAGSEHELSGWTEAAVLSPVDFGFTDISSDDWHRFTQRSPVFKGLWVPAGVSAWVLARTLKTPATLIQGSQAVVCAKHSPETLRRRLNALSLLVPALTARWEVFDNGSVALVSDGQAPVIKWVSKAEQWQPRQVFESTSDTVGFMRPCIFTVQHLDDDQLVIRCDYDLRAIDPGLVSAALKALSQGRMRAIQYALWDCWPGACGGPSGTLANTAVLTETQDSAAGLTPLPEQQRMSQYARERIRYWRQMFAPLVGKPHLCSWLPVTKCFDPDAPCDQLVRHTVIDAVAHSAKPQELSARLHGLICALQTIRHYVVRLWGGHPWVIHLVFANRGVVSKLGLDTLWQADHSAEPQCWMPLLIDGSGEKADDVTRLLDQLKQSGQYPVPSERQLLEWLEWPSEMNLSDVVLVVTDEEPDSPVSRDWHHFQLAPLQFQWGIQSPTSLRLAAHAGLSIVPEPQQPKIKGPLQVLEAQALCFGEITVAAARNFSTAELFCHSQALLANSPRELVVLDVAVEQAPEDPVAFSHQLQSYLAERLASWLLPDFVRVCSEKEPWGRDACVAWARRGDARHQSQLEERLTPVLLRADHHLFGLPQSGKVLSGGYRWFDRVGDRLPGWQAERMRYQLSSRQQRSTQFSLRAVRNLRQWTQWTDSGREEWKDTPNCAPEVWPLTPDQACWLAMESVAANHFTASLLLSVAGVEQPFLLEHISGLVNEEPIFRLHFQSKKARSSMSDESRQVPLVQVFSSLDAGTIFNAAVKRVDFSSLNMEQMLEGVSRVAAYWQSHFDLMQAPLVRFILFDGPRQDNTTTYLLVLGHRFALDHMGLCHLVSRLDSRLQGKKNTRGRTWRDWVAFLAQQRELLHKMPSAASHAPDQGVQQLELKLYERMSQILGLPKQALRTSTFRHSGMRRQFLPAIDDQLALAFSEGQVGVQDPRTVMGLAVLGLAIGSWLSLDHVVIGQWWPVREDPRARQWTDVVGSFEFLFKNPIQLEEGSALATARRLFQAVPHTLQTTITEVLARDHFDTETAFHLFSFERIDGQFHIPRFAHFSPMPHVQGHSVHPDNRRRSLIRVEAVFTEGQFSLVWVYDTQVLIPSRIECLVTHFAYYWQLLRQELIQMVETSQALDVASPQPRPRVIAPQLRPNRPAASIRPLRQGMPAATAEHKTIEKRSVDEEEPI